MPAETAAPAAEQAAVADALPPADHFEQSLKAALADVADSDDGDSAEAPKSTPERGKDGKFKPGGPAVKAKPKEAPADEAVEDEPDEPIAAKDKQDKEPVAEHGGLVHARKLVKGGQIAEALRLIGLEAEKLTGTQWKAFNAREAKAAQRERAATEKQQQLQTIARELAGTYGRFEQAQKAYEAGDHDEALRLAFNEDPSEFNRKLISKLHTKDPAVSKLERRQKELEQEIRLRDERAKAQADAARVEQSTRKYMGELSAELVESGDPRFERVAKKTAFVQKVLDIQREHWNPRLRSTISATEAAEQAWEELYSDVVAEEASARGTIRNSERGGSNQRKSSAKAGTSLKHSEAAEAAPEDLSQEDIFNFFVKKAMNEARA